MTACAFTQGVPDNMVEHPISEAGKSSPNLVNQVCKIHYLIEMKGITKYVNYVWILNLDQHWISNN